MMQKWTGRVVSALVVLFFVADGLNSLLAPGSLAPQMAETGFPAAMIQPVGIAALVAGLLYAWPRTAVLGAIVATGFLGGAIAIHARLGVLTAPPQLVCLIVGILAWAGLWLRDTGVRARLPMRSAAALG